MQPLNYCRQLIRSLESGNVQVANLIASSKKFMFPSWDLLSNDGYHNLDATLPLRLPFKHVAIEVDCVNFKLILVAIERDDSIWLWPFLGRNGIWQDEPVMNVPIVGYINCAEDGKYIAYVVDAEDANRDAAPIYANLLLAFCNALACRNVFISSVAPKKGCRPSKSSLPFDEYHVLTIAPQTDSTSVAGHAMPERCLPREHLRRGHPRTLKDGRQIWVNDAVIAAGRGAGVIRKDYAIKGPPQ